MASTSVSAEALADANSTSVPLDSTLKNAEFPAIHGVGRKMVVKPLVPNPPLRIIKPPRQKGTPITVVHKEGLLLKGRLKEGRKA